MMKFKKAILFVFLLMLSLSSNINRDRKVAGIDLDPDDIIIDMFFVKEDVSLI
ncbi:MULTISPECIES: hypothetical protein [Anaerococcus]|uniref:hypothetical protein n=1 Tax=Anaerococcus TaxID=165779 RepID=UPI0027BA781E|nr:MULTISPECIES: hypothetical protein [Anaerococcus]MDU2558545.1 hypothetical protein [Anaerococcus prevotii]MDU3137543.1 hypothetical protein [Anaerococcus prevotii]